MEQLIEEEESAFEFGLFEYAVLDLKQKFEHFNDDEYERIGHKPIETIKHRIKTLESIKKKLRKQNKPCTYEAVVNTLNDVAGMRIICPFIEDIYRVCLFIVEQPELELLQVKDYVREPKASGYRSVHLHVRVPVTFFKHREYIIVEIQIRTLAMDFWASLEHKLMYKSNFATDGTVIQTELIQYAAMLHEVDGRMQVLKSKMQGEPDKSEKGDE